MSILLPSITDSHPAARQSDRPLRRVAIAIALALSGWLVVHGATPSFTDITKAAGIAFVHNNGATGKRYYAETMGSGVIVFDADGDNWQDLLFVNSTHFPGEAGAAGIPAFYRNTGGATFANVTRVPVWTSSLRDGGRRRRLRQRRRIDVFITAWAASACFATGAGKFKDVTRGPG